MRWYISPKAQLLIVRSRNWASDLQNWASVQENKKGRGKMRFGGRKKRYKLIGKLINFKLKA